MPELTNRFANKANAFTMKDRRARCKPALWCFAATIVAAATTLPVQAQSTDASLTSNNETTDLSMVYERARVYDAEFQTAQYNLEAARSRVPLARSALRPQLSLDAEASLASVADDGDGPFEGTAISLSLSQAILDLSSSRKLSQSAISVRQAEAQYAAIGQTLILRVATAYFDVLRAQVNVDFSQSELQAIDRQREQAERRFDVGLVPVTDVRTAQAQLDLAVAQEIAAANQLSTAREALLRISGIDVQNPTPLANDLPLSPPEPANIDAWVELALQQNLELVSAKLANQNSQMQIDIEKASRYPTIDLVGSAASITTEQIGRFDSDSDSGEIKLQLNLPLLAGGSINASIAQARSEAKAANQELVTQERTTVQQTRDAYRGVLASISQVQALQQALASTEKSAEATDAGFRAGTRTSVEVLQALRDTFRAKSDFASARYDYIINMLNLKAASGSLSEDDLYAINRFLGIPEQQ